MSSLSRRSQRSCKSGSNSIEQRVGVRLSVNRTSRRSCSQRSSNCSNGIYVSVMASNSQLSSRNLSCSGCRTNGRWACRTSERYPCIGGRYPSKRRQPCQYDLRQARNQDFLPHLLFLWPCPHVV